MLRCALVIAPLFVVALSACPTGTHTGEGEGEAGGEGEGAAGEGEGEGGEGEGEGNCGAVTRDHECSGTTVEFCDENTGNVVSYDCAAAPFQNGTCGLVNTSWGNDCLTASGTACFFVDEGDFASSQLAACGTTGGCSITGETSSVCIDNSTPCSTADIGKCNGSAYTFGCNFLGTQDATDGQLLTGDCAALGGSCIADGAGTADPQIKGGCFVPSGQACTPFWTHCGTGPQDPNEADCPSTGTCP